MKSFHLNKSFSSTYCNRYCQ